MNRKYILMVIAVAFVAVGIIKLLGWLWFAFSTAVTLGIAIFLGRKIIDNFLTGQDGETVF